MYAILSLQGFQRPKKVAQVERDWLFSLTKLQIEQESQSTSGTKETCVTTFARYCLTTVFPSIAVAPK